MQTMSTMSNDSDEFMLTTIDNPFDPFEQFALWDLFDKEKGYFTSNYLARIVNLSDDMSQKEENKEIERAIDEIISLNPLGIYKKVKRKPKVNTNIA